VRRLLAGGVPCPGVRVEGITEAKKPSKTPEIDESGEKTDGFSHILAYKSPKNAVFHSKVLNKIYSQDVFRGIHEFSISLLKGTHAQDFIVRFSHFFGIIQY
jgi:hypothetical protein